MAQLIPSGATMHGIALGHDFRQNPTGSLGGRQVQQGQAQPPRTVGRVLSDAGRSIQNLASRFLNAVTPSGVRADSKFRFGLKDTSAELGRLLGSISQGPGQAADTATAQRLLGSLRTTADPVTRRGLAYDRLIVERTSVHLANMNQAQRQALYTGLLAAQNNPALANDPTLALVRGVMEQNAVTAGVAALQDDLNTAIAMVAQETQDKGVTGRAFDELYNTAREVLHAHGFGGLPRDELKHMQRALILQALEQRVQDPDNAQVLLQVGGLINHLPTRELHALGNEDRQLAGLFPDTTCLMVAGAVGLRAEQLEQTLVSGFTELLSHGRPVADDPGGLLHNPQGFARQVAQLGQALTDLRTHCDVHDLHFPPAVDDLYARAATHLEDYLTPSHLAQLPELSSGQLHAFGQGLRQLAVERGQTQITADAARRRAEALDQYASAMEPGLRALADGNMSTALQAMAQAQQRGDTALEVHMNLGLKVDGEDDVMNFRDSLAQHALQKLDNATLLALSQRINSPQINQLIDLLGDHSATLVSGGPEMGGYDPDIGRDMLTRVTELYLLREGVASALQASATPTPEPGWAGVAPNLAQLVLTHYGVAPSSDGNVTVRSGKGGPAMQDSLRSNIDEMLATPEKDPPHAIHPLVSDGFIKDLTRAQFAIAQADGTPPSNLLDPAAGDLAAQMTGAVTRLQALTGGNDALLLLATRLANQNVQAGIQSALLSQQSPVRMDDGTPGRLMGEEHNRYVFSSDGEGGLFLQVNYSIANANAFVPAPRDASEGVGVPVILDDAQSSTQMSFTLQIKADLSVTVSDPLRYSFSAVRAA